MVWLLAKLVFCKSTVQYKLNSNWKLLHIKAKCLSASQFLEISKIILKARSCLPSLLLWKDNRLSRCIKNVNRLSSRRASRLIRSKSRRNLEQNLTRDNWTRHLKWTTYLLCISSANKRTTVDVNGGLRQNLTCLQDKGLIKGEGKRWCWPQTVESQMKTACRRAQAAHPNFGTICDRDQNSTNKIHTDQAGFGDLHLSVL